MAHTYPYMTNWSGKQREDTQALSWVQIHCLNYPIMKDGKHFKLFPAAGNIREVSEVAESSSWKMLCNYRRFEENVRFRKLV